ncbi:unnamed protein product [Somion occarium]|uniref:Uncharacterized protein n=1 Tax=Somion occarium TaxID=3059160 RepID=A0ABP1DTY8_9APHY
MSSKPTEVEAVDEIFIQEVIDGSDWVLCAMLTQLLMLVGQQLRRGGKAASKGLTPEQQTQLKQITLKKFKKPVSAEQQEPLSHADVLEALHNVKAFLMGQEEEGEDEDMTM